MLNLRGGARVRQHQSRSTIVETSQDTTSAVNAHYSSQPISYLLTHLQTNPMTGLTSTKAKEGLKEYGPNQLQVLKGKSTFQLIVEQFEDKLVQILLVVAFLSALFSYAELKEHTQTMALDSTTILKAFMEPIIILTILILNAIVGVAQSQSAQGSLAALQSLQPTQSTVLRDGEWSTLPAQELVPGDIIQLRVGDKVPADSRLLSLETASFSVDEGSLTGESVTVSKLAGDEGVCDKPTLEEDGTWSPPPLQDWMGVVFSGTVVTSGRGVAVVVQTGMRTEMGRIQAGVTQAKQEEVKTPLGIKLDEFGESLTKIIGVICVLVWLVSIPKFWDVGFSSPLDGAVYYAKVAVALGVAVSGTPTA